MIQVNTPVPVTRRIFRPRRRAHPLIAGRMLADVIAGDSARFDVFERVHHLKLPGGKWFANPTLAMGMLYYRLNEGLQ